MDDSYELVPVDEFEALWVGHGIRKLVIEC
jgi:hypothetical protein